MALMTNVRVDDKYYNDIAPVPEPVELVELNFVVETCCLKFHVTDSCLNQNYTDFNQIETPAVIEYDRELLTSFFVIEGDQLLTFGFRSTLVYWQIEH